MTPEITKLLSQEIEPPMIAALRQYLVKSVNRSRSSMSKFYTDWDKALDVYRSVRSRDADDARARNKREPEKMTVPMSYAQVNTLVTFLFLAYTQKDSIFELSPTGSEDYGKVRDACQAVIDRELRQTNYQSKLVAALLDMARFNIGVMKTSWKYDSFEVEPEIDALSMLFDLNSGMSLESPQGLSAPMTEEVIAYEGNYVENISPWSFFYDTRLPLARWKEGRFAADETTFHFQDLREMEENGKLAGTEHISPFLREHWGKRAEMNRLTGIEPAAQKKGAANKDYMVAVTTVQAKIVPSDYELTDSKQQELWVFTLANDNRMLSAEPLNAPHREFTYDILTMSPDQHTELSDSLSMLIDPMQEVVTWLFNARIAAVRQNIEGRIVVDPTFVDVATLTAGNKYIMMKKNTPRLGVDKFLQQLRTVDPTTTHLQDAESIMRMMQTVSGVNENSMGQVATGRRSATENRAANAGAASRMKLNAITIWMDALSPQGRKMLLNCRQDLSFETFEKILGPMDAAEVWDLFHPMNPAMLVANEDYFSYDGTLSSEKNYIAQSLQELIGILASNPEVLASTGLDLVAMIEEVQSLRGIKNLSRFRLPPPPPVNEQSLAPGGSPSGASVAALPGAVNPESGVSALLS